MDLVQDGQNGFLTQPKNVENLAARMELLLTNEILRNSFSIKAQEYASQKSWKEVNRALFRGYEELIYNKGMENEEDSLTLAPEQTLFGTPKA